ncbi:hypothetical protein CDD80_2651 [Ophiocordyceps camponoti-rufipedis]|uniref:IDI-2 n=1 Tax=Ophiocordyceps camponoti-rufipedis TaxID=2004952 RepID=A0A2C5Z4Z0_9HYPO|nr:hypothetical protein CDD80_2651 [Ophiocordyceps camponoti-rufipedis]
MKFSSSILLVALQAAGVLSTPGSAADECGVLGVFKVDLTKLPAGVDPNAIRKCAEHPLRTSLNRRDCWYGNASGCSKGYCYRSCGTPGSGQWCWSANNGGLGSWIGCSKDSDCNTGMACGIGGCKSCGCSC